MLYFHADDDTRVVYDSDEQRILIEKPIAGQWRQIFDFQSKHVVVLSESFRDYCGYQFAVEALTAWAIPQASPLWVLGHKGGRNHWSGQSASLQN